MVGVSDRPYVFDYSTTHDVIPLETAPPPSVPSFSCPRCGRTSYHPDDVREGYCGACHDWTGAAQ